jgi:two-component system, cell cycle sensor histidine kinase and response regulator CckA
MDSKGNPGRSLVFADNDVLLIEAMGELLGSKGFEVHTARDGLEAFELVRKHKPDYVILDIVMPKLDGSRVCWLIRQDPVLRNTPIIAFSSLSPENFLQFPELSADAYVAKGALPVAFDNILRAMAYIDHKGSAGLSEGIYGYDGVRPRQLVQEMLRERQHYANILRSLGEGVLELDRNGRILMATPGASELLGANVTRLVGKTLAAFCQPEDRKVIDDLLAEFARANRPERCRSIVRFGNVRIPLRLCTVIEDGECTGFLAILESKE